MQQSEIFVIACEQINSVESVETNSTESKEQPKFVVQMQIFFILSFAKNYKKLSIFKFVIYGLLMINCI